MPKHAKVKEEKITTIRTKWDVTALFRVTSRAVEFRTLRGLTTQEMNELYSDPLLIRFDSIGSKKEVIVETKRIPISASKA